MFLSPSPKFSKISAAASFTRTGHPEGGREENRPRWFSVLHTASAIAMLPSLTSTVSSKPQVTFWYDSILCLCIVAHLLFLLLSSCILLFEGGKLVYQTTKKRASGPKCPVTGKRIQGVCLRSLFSVHFYPLFVVISQITYLIDVLVHSPF